MEFVNSLFHSLISFAEVISPQLNLIGRLVRFLNDQIGSYGLTVIVFTVILKLITLPFDYWQRVATKKNAVLMERMKPLIANVDKQYANDPRRANAEKSKLYKKSGYSMASSCLSMIAMMVVFGIMFSGLNSYSNYINKNDYALLEKAYDTAYQAQIDNGKTQYEAMLAGKEAVGITYKTEVQESFLWIRNIWRPDTWKPSMSDATTFENGGMGLTKMTAEEKANFDRDKYNVIYQGVLETNPGYFSKTKEDGTVTPGWNGLLITPILAVALSILSSYISQKQNKTSTQTDPNDPTQQTSKMMMYMLPIMFGIFALLYTAAFAVYMVSNSLLSIITSFVLQPIATKVAMKSIEKQDALEEKASYKR